MMKTFFVFCFKDKSGIEYGIGYKQIAIKNMEIKIRQEQENDYKAVYELIELAFRNMEESDHSEHFLVERLRKSEAFIPELSLVAEKDGEIIGHILMTKVEIVSAVKATTTLALAPVAVLPKYQGQGVGGTLICEVHKRATELGYGSAVLLGHKDYYPKFGYKKAIDFGIEFPFEVPYEYCMVIELLPNALKNVQGVVKYSKPFINE
ncbi:N-acetyltransferase [Bacteroides faecalis]|uniref:N-acetyltransferase n=2 Tax=Bacteroides faecalis TaxID=2447885 RepID=A0A401LRZ3_9BACE|nr:N-acetyltransferase [Bacteroides faecalis]